MKIRQYIFCLLFASVLTNAQAQTGTLDTSFGDGGKIIVFPTISDMVCQPDDKIVTINKQDNVDYYFTLYRYLKDGATDKSFGKAGVVKTQIPHAGLTFGQGITLQPDGKIVAVGSAITPHGHFALLRYLSGGMLDSAFGNNGIVVPKDSNYEASLHRVAIQTDGKIVACGHRNYDFALIRLHENGTVDNAFGEKGMATFPYDGFDEGLALSIQPDGKILVGGSYQNIGGDGAVKVLITRFNANGTTDFSFGTNGAVLLNDSRIGDALFRAMLLDKDGTIIIGAQLPGNGTIAIARLQSNGSFDSSFANKGFLELVPPYRHYYDFETLALQDDGKIIVDGIYYLNGRDNQVVLRLMPDGTSDAAFGSGGKTITHFGNYYYYRYEANAAAIQSNGDILFGGNLITRYHGDAGTAPLIVGNKF